MPRKKQIENALEDKPVEEVSSILRNLDDNEVVVGAMAETEEDRAKVEAYVKELGERERIERGRRSSKEFYRSESIIGAEDDDMSGLYTEEQARYDAFQKLNQSYVSGAVLKGTILKAERRDLDPEHPQVPTAIVQFENDDFFEIKIPITEFFPQDELKSRVRGETARDMMNYMDYLFNLRNGAPVRFIVQKLDERTGEVIASRNRAMNQMKRRYWFARNRDGIYDIRLGSKVLGTVIYVAQYYMCVESMGVEVMLYTADVSWQRYNDLREAKLKREPNGVMRPYAPGDPIELRVMGLKRTFSILMRDKEGRVMYDEKGNVMFEKDENGKKITLGENEVEGKANIVPTGVDVVLSAKEVYGNPDEKKFNKFVVGDKVMAEVTHVDRNGIFCKLSGLRSGMIRFDPDNTDIPRPGDRCWVRIVGMNKENYNITCEIVKRFW